MADLKLNPKAQIALLIITVISVGLYFIGKQFSQESIQAFVESAGPWAPIVWIITHQLSYILAPVSGYPFLIIGFYLFGQTTIVYTLIVAIIGSSINFFIARKWGRPITAKLAGHEAISKIDKLEKQYGLGTLFVVRFFLVGLGDFISYAYGLTPIKYPVFIAVSTLAMIPGYALWYFIATKTGNIEQFLGVSVVLTFIASGIFIAGTYISKKLKRR